MIIPHSDQSITTLAYIDIHCHHYTLSPYLAIVSHDIGDFNPLAEQNLFTLGLHPWFINASNYQATLQKLAEVGANPHLIAIGECGLDKKISTAMDTQLAVFSWQLQLAAQLQKPVMIHCVRAFNELAALKKQYPLPHVWILHGFNAKPVIAKQLITLGCYFSFGKALLNPESNAVKVLAMVPLDRLFFETDESNEPIENIYLAAANILSLSLKSLQNIIQTNFNKVFNPPI